MKSYDIIILGSGPAGMTAGLFTARNELKTAIISKDIGGTANMILNLENWPGYSGNGPNLMKQFYDQVRKYKEAEFLMKDVENIEKKENRFIIKTKKEEYEAKAIIISTGTERRKLSIPGEKELIGKGVSYCFTCDGPFFKDKIVGVIGGRDCAATSALALSSFAKKVYVFYRGEKLKCEEITEDQLENKKNVEIIYNSLPIKMNGKEKLESLEIKQLEDKRTIKLDGLFIEIGSTPLTKFTEKLGIKLNQIGEIVVDEYMKTSVEGVFAAGDVTNHKNKLLIIASGQGAIAGKSAYEFLQNSK